MAWLQRCSANKNENCLVVFVVIGIAVDTAAAVVNDNAHAINSMTTTTTNQARFSSHLIAWWTDDRMTMVVVDCRQHDRNVHNYRCNFDRDNAIAPECWLALFWTDFLSSKGGPDYIAVMVISKGAPLTIIYVCDFGFLFHFLLGDLRSNLLESI